MKIVSIYSFLPKNTIQKKDIKKILKSNFNKIINYTGFNKLHVLKKNISTDEFIFSALKKYIQESKINKKKIDGVIFCSHSRVQEMPIFSANIQNRLGLKNNILCYDLPSSCSGFTSGLMHANAFMQSKMFKNILIICADTHSKNLKNKNLRPIISDGVSIINCQYSNDFFYYDTGVDGKNNQILNIDIKKKSLNMDGIKVLEFALNRVPKTINFIEKKLLKKKINLDYYSLHQPNKTMFNFIVKKIKAERKKVIDCVNFGNTSSPSIPISLSNFFDGKIIKNKTFLFCGFGSGLSWTTISLKLKKTFISKILYI